MTDGRYEFTSDWVTSKAPQWETLLADLLGKPHVQAVEIGSYEGRSAVWFLENLCTHPKSRLTCIDVWGNRDRELRFDRNIAATGQSDRLRKIKGPSWRVLPTLRPETVDFVYVDGSHEAADALLDGLLALQVLKPGGVLLFDDYRWEGDRHHQPAEGIDAFLRLCDWQVEELSRGWQLAVRKLP